MFADLLLDAPTLGDPRLSIPITAVLLVVFLIAKEAATAVPDRRGRAVGKVLDVVVVPLLIVFATIVALPLVAPAP